MGTYEITLGLKHHERIVWTQAETEEIALAAAQRQNERISADHKTDLYLLKSIKRWDVPEPEPTKKKLTIPWRRNGHHS